MVLCRLEAHITGKSERRSERKEMTIHCLCDCDDDDDDDVIADQ